MQSVAPIAEVDKGAAVTPSSSGVKIYHNVNPDTGTHFYFAVHNPSSATTDDSFTFPISTADGDVHRAAGDGCNGQDAKIARRRLRLGGQHLVYSTSEIDDPPAPGPARIAVAAATAATARPGETVLRYASAADGDGPGRRRSPACSTRRRATCDLTTPTTVSPRCGSPAAGAPR